MAVWVALLAGAFSFLVEAQETRYPSSRWDFSLALPAGYQLQDRGDVKLNLIAWQLAADHEVCAAVWSMNRGLSPKSRSEIVSAVEALRAAHRCGERVCATTEPQTRGLEGGGTFFFYEVKDPAVPSDRGVLSGILEQGSERYRVQATNYSERNKAREDLFRALASIRPSAEGIDRAIKGVRPDRTLIDFSAESDLGMGQSSRSGGGGHGEPARESLPEPAPLSKPAAKPSPPKPAAKPAKPRSAAAQETVRPVRKPEVLPAPQPIPIRAAPPKPEEPNLEEPDPVMQRNTLPVLIELLAHPQARTRYRAADELGHRGEEAKEAVPRLIEALKDPDARVRSSAAQALGNIGPSAASAVPRLRSLLEDRSQDVRLSARTALDRLPKH